MPKPTPLPPIETPDWVSEPVDADTEAEPPPVVSPEENGTLVGGSVEQMKRDSQRLIAADPDHPLRFLLGRDEEFRPVKNLEHIEMINKPDLVQMGHVKSKKALGEGEREHVVLQSASRNQGLNKSIEKASLGETHQVSVAIDIGGVGVCKETAGDWEARGWLEPGTVDNAPVLDMGL